MSSPEFSSPSSGSMDTEQLTLAREITPQLREQWRERNKNVALTDEQITFVTSGVISPGDTDLMLELFRSLEQRDETELRMQLQSKVEAGSEPAQHKLELLEQWSARAHLVDDVRYEQERMNRKRMREMDLDNPDNRYGRITD